MPSRITFYEVKLDFKETITKVADDPDQREKRSLVLSSLSTEDPSFQPQAKNIFFSFRGKRAA